MPLDLEQLVELDDAAMALATGHEHVAQGVDLAMEVVHGLFAGGAVGDHHLDGHPPVPGDLPGPVNGSHTPLANQLLDEVIGARVGEALCAWPRTTRTARSLPPAWKHDGGSTPIGRGGWCVHAPGCRAVGGRCVKLHPAACAGTLDLTVAAVRGEMDGEATAARRHHVALAKQHAFHAQTVDLRSIRASQVDQVASRRKVLDLEVLA